MVGWSCLTFSCDLPMSHREIDLTRYIQHSRGGYGMGSRPLHDGLGLILAEDAAASLLSKESRTCPGEMLDVVKSTHGGGDVHCCHLVRY